MTMSKPTGEPEQWEVSPFSGGNGDCIEVGELDGGFAVRDSKDRSGPVLRFTDGEVAAFARWVKEGRFDHLLR